MSDGPNIVGIAALIGDQARSAMLIALMNGSSLTATELATEANISKQTASSHLAKLTESGLIFRQSQGRHKYYRLADPDVAELLEKLMGVASRTGATRILPGPRDPALRHARVCYDHLAGQLAVQAFDFLSQGKLIELGETQVLEDGTREKPAVRLTSQGADFFRATGIAIDEEPRTRRQPCLACLDWSVRRYHLAGTVGASLLNFCYDQRWAKRNHASRVVTFTKAGEMSFKKLFACETSAVPTAKGVRVSNAPLKAQA